MLLITRPRIFLLFRNQLETLKKFSSENYYDSYNSAEDSISHDSAKLRSKVKNPNSVIIRGDIFAINRDEDGNHVRITLKVRRESVTRAGEPYIRSEYFNVNFYGVSDPIRRWKMPKFYAVGDNVSTYSNLGRAVHSDIMYLKGYAMTKHSRMQASTGTAEIAEEDLNSFDLDEDDEDDEISTDEMK